jgi:hypothetical protein
VQFVKVGGDVLMLLRTSAGELSARVSFSKLAVTKQSGLVLSVKVAGETKHERWLRAGCTEASHTLDLSFQDVSVATVSDDATHENEGDAPLPPFLEIFVHRAVHDSYV